MVWLKHVLISSAPETGFISTKTAWWLEKWSVCNVKRVWGGWREGKWSHCPRSTIWWAVGKAKWIFIRIIGLYIINFEKHIQNCVHVCLLVSGMLNPIHPCSQRCTDKTHVHFFSFSSSVAGEVSLTRPAKVSSLLIRGLATATALDPIKVHLTFKSYQRSYQVCFDDIKWTCCCNCFCQIFVVKYY